MYKKNNGCIVPTLDGRWTKGSNGVVKSGFIANHYIKTLCNDNKNYYIVQFITFITAKNATVLLTCRSDVFFTGVVIKVVQNELSP